MSNLFTKIPNEYIQTDISKLGLNKKFYLIYLIADRNKTRENMSYITLDMFTGIFGANEKNKRSYKYISEITDCIKRMVELNFFETPTDLSKLRYATCITLILNDKIFNPDKNYTTIDFSIIDKILDINYKGNKKENILITYLYVKSYIYGDAKSFYKRIDAITTLPLSRGTITQCLSVLVDELSLLSKVSGRGSSNIYTLN